LNLFVLWFNTFGKFERGPARTQALMKLLVLIWVLTIGLPCSVIRLTNPRLALSLLSSNHFTCRTMDDDEKDLPISCCLDKLEEAYQLDITFAR
jgi:hypothetical protein